MSKKTLKLISVITIVLCVIMAVSTCFAIDPGDITPNDENVPVGLTNLGKQAVSIIRTIGVIAAVIILMILGIKYMMGSAEEKAEYKKTMIPYVIGAILLFAASAIATLVMNVSNSVGDALTEDAKVVIDTLKMLA